MKLAAIWIALGLIFAVVVLVIAGRVMSNEKEPQSLWQTFMSDLTAILVPAGLQLGIIFQSVLVKLGKSPDSLNAQRAKLTEVRSERKRERDIAKMSSLDSTDYSNLTLEEFLSATATSEPAYAEVEVLSGRIEHIYDSVQEKRAKFKNS